jgi:hypothetical protein
VGACLDGLALPHGALERDGSRRSFQGPNIDVSQSDFTFHADHVIIYDFMRDDIDVDASLVALLLPELLCMSLMGRLPTELSLPSHSCRALHLSCFPSDFLVMVYLSWDQMISRKLYP